MAWIYSKKTKVMTECHNNDVIKICKKDVDGYVVKDNLSELKSSIKENDDKEKKPDNAQKSLDKMKVSELKAIAEEKGIENIESLTKAELLKVLEDHGCD